MGHILKSVANTAIDSTGIHGLQKAASSFTNLDPTGSLPTGLVNTAENLAPVALSFIPAVGPAVAAAYSAAHNYGQTGNLGSSLLDGAKSFGLSELGGALGNEVGIGSGNSLTDLLGTTQGAGNLGAYGTELFNGSDSAPSSTSTSGIASGSSSTALTGSAGAGTITPNLGESSFLPTSSPTADPLSGTSYSIDPSGSGLTTSPMSSVSGNQTPIGGFPNYSNASNAAGGSVASSSGLSKYLLPAAGAATSLYENSQALGQLKNATAAANAQLSPYTATGAGAENKLSNYLGLGGTGTGASSADILSTSPGYQFALDQGNQELDRQAAARGNYFSGAALKAGQQYASGLADQTANNYYSQLAGTAGQGLSAAGTVANNTTSLGSAGANSDIATGNTLAQLLSGVGKTVKYVNGLPVYS